MGHALISKTTKRVIVFNYFPIVLEKFRGELNKKIIRMCYDITDLYQVTYYHFQASTYKCTFPLNIISQSYNTERVGNDNKYDNDRSDSSIDKKVIQKEN